MASSPSTTMAIPNDLESYWVPFTPNRAFKKAPRLIARAKDMHYYTPDGRAVLDGTAGLWCTNAGHNRDPIVAAIRAQAAELDYAPAFQFAHPKAFELASRIAALAPGTLDHVFFTNSGSEAVDTALKIALAFHNIRGQGARTRLIGLRVFPATDFSEPRPLGSGAETPWKPLPNGRGSEELALFGQTLSRVSLSSTLC